MPGPVPPDDDQPLFDRNDPLFAFIEGMWQFLNRHEQLDPIVLRQEAETLLARHPAPEPRPGTTAREQAQDLVDEAWESDDRGPYLALDALKLDANCADAYVCLGHNMGAEPELALAMFALALLAGSSTLGAEMFERHAGEFWGIVETRPFMRALEGMARTTWEMGQHDVAMAYYHELLQLNPTDNQGARYPLLALALESANRDIAEGLLGAYAADTSAMWHYGRALDAFQRLGDANESRAALATARSANPHVPPFLSGARSLPEDEPDLHSRGEQSEAVVCADLLLDAWEATEGAIAWLRGQSGPPPAPSKEKRQGPRVVD